MELIDRQEVVNLICDSKDLKELFDRVYDEIPIIESRPKGKWVGGKCSNCGDIDILNPYAYVEQNGEMLQVLAKKFCPNCGADMRGKE